ncbi:hypothetical protein GCM10009836_06590 [Pseudonocardia ailaonensis]|uniref:Lycopene cyclase n=1 Tax=Pseudonocardia ailaonensis TaxID=367279 RepID=A0ABN2MLR5_9PSEU
MTGLDVVVAGGGPAGRALAAACAAAGLETALADPAPDRHWRSTYAAWAGELPGSLPPQVVAARARGRAIALGEHDLGWEYAVLDTAALRSHLDDGLAGVAVHRARLRPDGRVVDEVGRAVPARIVVDATGHRVATRTGSGETAAGGSGVARGGRATMSSGRPAADHRWRRRSPAAEQTAYGIVVDEGTASAVVEPGSALFMDWRRDHGRPGWPSFLYAVPLGEGEVLLEETSLARRPGLPLPELRERLHARLAHHGITVPEGAREERVRFPVDGPLHPSPSALTRDAVGALPGPVADALLRHLPRRGAGSVRSGTDPGRAGADVGVGVRSVADLGALPDVAPIAFGAATPLVHPATGFSVATALALAPRLAAALTSDDPHRAARRVLWSPAALAVHALRRRGLEALLRMPSHDVPAFFETFLGLPARHRWAYLTGREDLPGTLAAMGALYRHAGHGLRARLVGPAFLPAAAPLPTG